MAVEPNPIGHHWDTNQPAGRCEYHDSIAAKSLRMRKLRNGRPGGIRTPDPRFRKPLLYPSELQAHTFLSIT